MNLIAPTRTGNNGGHVTTRNPLKIYNAIALSKMIRCRKVVNAIS